MGVIVEADSKKEADNDDENRSDASVTVDDDGDELEGELDVLYEQYKSRRSEADTKYRAKMARREHEVDEWHGFSAASSSDEDTLREDSDESDIEENEEGGKATIITTLESEGGSKTGLSKRAEMFFEQGIFKDLGPLQKEDGSQQLLTANPEKIKRTIGSKRNIDTVTEEARSKATGSNSHAKNRDVTSRDGTKRDSVEEEDGGDEESEPEAGLDIPNHANGWEDDDEEPVKDGKPDIDIITAEAMTLAQQIASGTTTRQQIVDDGFNKYSFRDTDGLPEWFLDDEAKHSRPHRPITAAAAAAIKEKMRALNARPIKKVREAKERKKYKAAQRLEKLRKKSALMADDENMTEQEKAHNIAKLMSKAAKRKPKQQVKVVVAKHANRGIAGRPRGVKGKYKIVDARLKKDVRAQKRLAKKRR
jgi:AdoMet-dependent rRNA methyltransferase SPB1